MKKFRMPRFAPIVLATALLVQTPQRAEAYDSDTHFLMTLLMCQYAGINPEVADMLAAYSQFIDVSVVTSPMVPTLVIGGRIRRFFHFPGSLQQATSKSHGILKFKFMNIATENHPFGSEVFTQGGLIGGSLLMAGAGLHPIEDTYGHSGYTAQIGHATAGHWPDRPFYDPAKYERMIRQVFEAIVAIRESLPPTASEGANSKRSAEDLANEFLARPDVKSFIQYNVFKDPAYTKPAVEFLLFEAEKVGFLTRGARASSLLPGDDAYRPGREVQDILKEVILAHMASFDPQAIERIYPGTGIGTRLSPSEWNANRARVGDSKTIVDILVDIVADAHIADVLMGPLQPDGSMFVAEKETPLRTLEMKLRTNKLHEIQKALFGRVVEFGERGYSSRGARARSRTEADRHEGWQQIQDVLNDADPMTEYVQLTLGQKFSWYVKMVKFVFLDALVGKFRFKPTSNNLEYQDLRLLRENTSNGTYRIPLTPEQHAKLLRAYQARKCSAALEDHA